MDINDDIIFDEFAVCGESLFNNDLMHKVVCVFTSEHHKGVEYHIYSVSRNRDIDVCLLRGFDAVGMGVIISKVSYEVLIRNFIYISDIDLQYQIDDSRIINALLVQIKRDRVINKLLEDDSE